jgi:hypothetical protein
MTETGSVAKWGLDVSKAPAPVQASLEPTPIQWR